MKPEEPRGVGNESRGRRGRLKGGEEIERLERCEGDRARERRMKAQVRQTRERLAGKVSEDTALKPWI